MRLSKAMIYYLKWDVIGSLLAVLVITGLALLSGCSSPQVKPLPKEIETITVERCYSYQHFSTEQWDVAIDWLTEQPLDSVPSLMVEDYIRLRTINECKEAENE